MKVVIAIDSLKGSMTSMEAGRAIEEGIKKVVPDAEVLVKPLADGGEGTTEALSEGLGGENVKIQVHGPLETPVEASYAVIKESKTAILEIATAAGIILVGKDKRPLDATTYGVGEIIKDAIQKGVRDFIIGIGGSATNDCGIGMLSALGYEFYDEHHKKVGISAGDLKNVSSICTEHVLPELKDCHFRIACDVTNPLCGENGATYIFGPQKGVTDEIKEELDGALKHFADVTALCMGNEFQNASGAGAAGGLGFAFLSYLSADLEPGIELVLDAVQMDKAMEDADFVFTGEGRLDYQTAMGKTPVRIVKLAKLHGAKVIALAGAVIEGAEKCNENGIDAYFPILREIVTLDEAMDGEVARRNMINTTEQIVRLITAVQ